MFTPLISALKAQGLAPGETIGLRKLCEASGLSVSMWADKLAWPSSRFLVNEELRSAGFEVRLNQRGRHRAFTFLKLDARVTD